MQPKQNQIKFVSLHHKDTKVPPPQCNRITELQLQLQQALAHLQVYKEANKNLCDKLAYYERKCQDMKLLEQELQFRREQEKHMQQHLDNYQQINARLREQINELQSSLKSKQRSSSNVLKPNNNSASQHSETFDNSRKMSTQLYLDESKISTGRRSLGNIEKQNHPITPKSRVNINFQQFGKNEIQLNHQIKARRKVFL